MDSPSGLLRGNGGTLLSLSAGGGWLPCVAAHGQPFAQSLFGSGLWRWWLGRGVKMHNMSTRANTIITFAITVLGVLAGTSLCRAAGGHAEEWEESATREEGTGVGWGED